MAYDSFGVQVYYERTVTVAEPLPPTPPPPSPPPVQASAVRHYIYDAHQQLCKVIEPETGATVMAYDGAGNLQWTAAGLDLPSTVDCEQAAAAASGRREYNEERPKKAIGGMTPADYVKYLANIDIIKSGL